MSAVVDSADRECREERPWVVFFGDDWGRHNSTAQYLARALLADYRVLWVNSLGLREPRFDRTDLARMVRKLAALFRPSRGIDSASTSPPPAGLVIAAPLAVPYWRYRVVRLLNKVAVGRHLRSVARKRGIHRPIAVAACPAAADMIDAISPARRIYYCADEHAVLAGMDARTVARLEHDLLGRVDTVMAVSRNLVAAKRRLHPDVRYLPHGVNFAHLHTAVTDRLSEPEELHGLPELRAIYVGLIGEHLDLDLLARVAETLPRVAFVMIGPIEAGTEPPAAANMHYLGARSYSAVPSYLAHCAVGLLPWKTGERNYFASPAKVREYLAAGCSVVATPHTELEGLSAHVTTAGTAERFAEAIAERLAVPTPRSVIAAPLAGQDWSARARVLMDGAVE